MVELNFQKNGLVLAAISSFVFALCSLIAKQLENTHPIQLGLYSFCGISLCSSTCVFKSREKLLPRGYFYLILIRSLCGCLFFILSFYSVQAMPLGDASVLLYTTPVWTLILARLFLNEPCRISNFVSIAAAMLGVIFVTQPEIIFGYDVNNDIEPASHKYSLGACSAIVASISEAAGNVILRKLKTVDPSIILFNYSTCSVFICLLVGYPFSYIKFSIDDNIILIVALSLLTVVEQYLMVTALTVEHAGPVAIVQASDIIYGYILEVIFYDEEINTLSLTGAVIVGLVVVQMATQKDNTVSNFTV